jgi:hypothetical protein
VVLLAGLLDRSRLGRARSRGQAMTIATGVFLAWFGLTAWALGAECWLSYPRYLQFSSQQFGTSGIDPLRMYNLKGLLTALLQPEHARLINALTTAALLLNVVVVLWLWRGPWRPDAPDFDLRLGYTLLLAAVCNPHFNPTDALVLVVPAILVLGSLQRDSLQHTGASAVLIFCPLLLLIDVYTHPWPGDVRPFFLLMLGALLWLAWLLHGPVRIASSNTGSSGPLLASPETA